MTEPINSKLPKSDAMVEAIREFNTSMMLLGFGEEERNTLMPGFIRCATKYAEAILPEREKVPEEDYESDFDDQMDCSFMDGQYEYMKEIKELIQKDKPIL